MRWRTLVSRLRKADVCRPRSLWARSCPRRPRHWAMHGSGRHAASSATSFRGVVSALCGRPLAGHRAGEERVLHSSAPRDWYASSIGSLSQPQNECAGVGAPLGHFDGAAVFGGMLRYMIERRRRVGGVVAA